MQLRVTSFFFATPQFHADLPLVQLTIHGEDGLAQALFKTPRSTQLHLLQALDIRSPTLEAAKLLG